MDADFIFRLNYGPLSAQEVKSTQAMMYQYDIDLAVQFALKKASIKADKEIAGRTEMTFLDRPIAAKLKRALYNSLQFVSFETDGSGNGDTKAPTRGISPFDYDSSSEQTFPMLWAENFVISWAWNKGYSSSIIGSVTKPPMAAVVLDMIDLVNYLKSISEPKTIVAWLTAFVRNNRLQSLIQDGQIDEEWAGRGYIADLFSIVACLECTSDGPPSVVAGLDHRQTFNAPMPPYTRTIPGFGVLIPLANTVSKAALELSNSVDELRAGFIHSGPFKLKVTRKLAKHLSLNKENQLRVFQYWGKPIPEKGLPKNPSLRIYQNHALRRCSTILLHTKLTAY